VLEDESNQIEPMQFKLAYEPMDPTIPAYSDKEFNDMSKGTLPLENLDLVIGDDKMLESIRFCRAETQFGGQQGGHLMPVCQQYATETRVTCYCSA
jgi:hypothetical protein